MSIPIQFFNDALNEDYMVSLRFGEGSLSTVLIQVHSFFHKFEHYLNNPT